MWIYGQGIRIQAHTHKQLERQYGATGHLQNWLFVQKKKKKKSVLSISIYKKITLNPTRIVPLRHMILKREYCSGFFLPPPAPPPIKKRQSHKKERQTLPSSQLVPVNQSSWSIVFLSSLCVVLHCVSMAESPLASRSLSSSCMHGVMAWLCCCATFSL